MSVNRPESGWQAALAIRYADASQERRESELKEVEIGALRVAMTVALEVSKYLASEFGL